MLSDLGFPSIKTYDKHTQTNVHCLLIYEKKSAWKSNNKRMVKQIMMYLQ